jgi:hypothetical protein
VLLAAHCVESKNNINKIQPELSYFMFQNNWSDDGIVFHISEIMVHPDWNVLTKPYEADIAIAILKEPVEFSSNVTNICLNSPTKPVDDNFIDQSGFVAGWGHTESSFEAVSELRTVTVPIVERDKCKESTALRDLYSETLFCAGDIKRKAGPCRGKGRKHSFHFILSFSSFLINR